MPQLTNAQILLSQMTSTPESEERTDEPEERTELLKRTVPSGKKDLRTVRGVPIADTLTPPPALGKTADPTEQDEKKNDNGD